MNIMKILRPAQIAQAQLFINRAEPGGYQIEEIFGENWKEISSAHYLYAQRFRISVTRRLFENIKCIQRYYGEPFLYNIYPD